MLKRQRQPGQRRVDADPALDRLLGDWPGHAAEAGETGPEVPEGGQALPASRAVVALEEQVLEDRMEGELDTMDFFQPMAGKGNSVDSGPSCQKKWCARVCGRWVWVWWVWCSEKTVVPVWKPLVSV